MKHLRSSIKVVLVAAAAFAGGATISWAHGGDTALVHACYAAVGQPLIASDPSGNGCGNAPTRIDWAIAGPSGPAGPAGATGPAGPAGAPGPAGSAADAKPKFTIVSRKSPSNDALDKTVIAYCPTGTIAVTGGWNLSGRIAGRNAVVTSAPVSSGGKSGWLIEIQNYPGIGEKGEPWQMQVYGVCEGTPEGISLPPIFPKH